MFADGYVGTTEDGVRIRRQLKERESERKKFEAASKEKKDEADKAGLKQFAATTSEALEHAFKNETIGLVSKADFVKKRTTLQESAGAAKLSFAAHEDGEEEGDGAADMGPPVPAPFRLKLPTPLAQAALDAAAAAAVSTAPARRDTSPSSKASKAGLASPSSGTPQEGAEASPTQGDNSAAKRHKQEPPAAAAAAAGGVAASSPGAIETGPPGPSADVSGGAVSAGLSSKPVAPGVMFKKKLGKDPRVVTSFLPDQERERQAALLREELKQEWLAQQNMVKSEPLAIVYSYWDGAGHRREIKVKKGDSIGQFLKAVREQLLPEFRELRHVSVDNLLYVKEDIILPHHHTFYDLIISKARGKSGPLFDFGVHEDIRVVNDASREKNESHAGKVVERHWYDRNKHIFPASRWEVSCWCLCCSLPARQPCQSAESSCILLLTGRRSSTQTRSMTRTQSTAKTETHVACAFEYCLHVPWVRHDAALGKKHLHPELSPPFPKNVIADEVAEAFGRRSITKLPAEELPHEVRAHALRVFNGLLTTQEHKNDAINRGACIPLTQLIESSPSFEARKLSCEALASLAQVLPGRQAIAAARGMYALTAALQSTPEAAAGAFRVLDTVVPALVTLITLPSQDDITLAACTNTASTLAGICTTDAGIESCLQHSVPAAVVALATRCLTEHTMEGLEACADCLEQLAHHPAGKTALRETRAIEMLATMLSHCMAHRGAMLKATSALLGVSVEKESKVPVMLFAGVQLVRLVKDSPDEYLVANARAAVVSASEHLEARSMTQALLSDREQMDLIFKGPLPPAPPDFRYRVVLPYGANGTCPRDGGPLHVTSAPLRVLGDRVLGVGEAGVLHTVFGRWGSRCVAHCVWALGKPVCCTLCLGAGGAGGLLHTDSWPPQPWSRAAKGAGWVEESAWRVPNGNTIIITTTWVGVGWGFSVESSRPAQLGATPSSSPHHLRGSLDGRDSWGLQDESMYA
ncbi:uncharacterized protein HaLaN_12759 [Haematococcus lacustris]|uniref:FAM50A/XAP5 C-terminal domain-containing protein n=1 Tax=Haematococcus lacustris TaxID=44745 RepID=A0A699Z1G5_HAELA|nr:uncharacterized protein HaLaN_12759 [Haematococcus lacustris]